MSVSTDGFAAQGIPRVSREQEVKALCSAAASASRDGNRIAALALLWAAVAVAPTDFLAHRRLAAALMNGGDLDAAAEEYARYVEFMVSQGDIHRAVGELEYARAFLGDVRQLRLAATLPVPLADVARALERAARAQASLSLPSVRSVETPRTDRPYRRARGRSWWARWTSSLSQSDAFQGVLIVTFAAAVTTVVVATVGGLR